MRPALAIIALSIATTPAHSQQPDVAAGFIGLYADVSATTQHVVDDTPSVLNVYVVHRNTTGATGSEFMVEPSAGFDMLYIADSIAPGLLGLGNSQTGISFSYTSCIAGDLVVLTIVYFRQGTSEPCSFLDVVPHPTPGTIHVVDCNSTNLVAASGRLTVGPTPTCHRELAVPAEYPTIQMAVDAAAPKDTVRLASGTYTGSGNRDVDFRGKPLVLTSLKGADSTVIDCEYGGRGLYIHSQFEETEVSGISVIRGSHEDTGSNILIDSARVALSDMIVADAQHDFADGGGIRIIDSDVTIRRAEICNNDVPYGYGAGISAVNSSVDIDSCDFCFNYTSSEGGAIHLVSTDLHVTNTSFRDNNAEQGFGGAAISGDVAFLNNCLFEHNIAYHGAAILGSVDSLLNCTFDGNEGGLAYDCEGVAINGSANYVANNVFKNSIGFNPGAVIVGSVATLKSNLFLNNEGDVSQIDGAVGLMENNTFVIPVPGSGSVAFDLGATYAKNNIFYQPASGTMFQSSDSSVVTIECSDIYAPLGTIGTGAFTDGGGNIYSDPQFCDPLSDDYGLLSSSPALSLLCGQIGKYGVGCYTEEPTIISITDVGNDQGRQARLSWYRSDYDALGDSIDITGYDVYRRKDLYAAAPEAEAEAAALFPGWDYVVTVPARGDSEYQYVAPTLCDSTIVAGQCWSAFMISARTSETLIFFDSDIDSGYSIDNLSPAVPAGVAAAYNTGFGNTISWDPNSESDLGYYAVYRADHPGFTKEEATFVGTTTSTSWTDAEYDGWDVYYAVSAVDFSGNEGDMGEPDGPSTDAAVRLGETILGQNSPNPFNPSTTIQFNLSHSGMTELTVFSVTGARVATLLNKVLTAGAHESMWNGQTDAGTPASSGVYFYRLKVEGTVLTKQMVLLK